MRLALRSRPLSRFVLVTDAMSCVGSDITQFTLDGRTIYVGEGRCVDAKGTLAGASLDMGAAVRNTMEMAQVSLAVGIPSSIDGAPSAIVRRRTRQRHATEGRGGPRPRRPAPPVTVRGLRIHL